MDESPQQDQQKKEIYGDPIRFRMASEYFRIMDDLEPAVLGAIEFITENKSIDEEWRMTIADLRRAIITLKWAIFGFKTLLNKEDADMVRNYDECYRIALKRKERIEVPHGTMEGRAELFARMRLALEDKAAALYLQTLDIRAVAFKNKMWDLTNRPPTKGHGTELRRQT